VFTFDPSTLELWKAARPVRVRPQSLKLLALLLSRPGELISRDEIQRGLWGDETFVDYEQGVNHSIKELRVALGDAAESPRFIQTLPRRGYRFIAPVERRGEWIGEPKPVPEGAAHAVASDARPAATVSAPTPRSRARSVTAAVVVVAIAAAGLALGWQRWFSERRDRDRPAAITVLPFTTSGTDPALGAGLANAISRRLGGQRLVSINQTSADEPASLAPRSSSLDAAAGSSGATLILSGEVTRSGDQVGVTARLSDARGGDAIWSEPFRVRADELFSLENVIAERIVAALDLRLAASEQEQLRRRYTSNAAAYEDYLRGRADLVRYRPEATRRAIEYFEKALEQDPGYALARAGLAMACADMFLRFAPSGEAERWGERAEAEVRTALHLDPNLAEAHLARAAAARKREFDWATVMSASQRALILNPNLEQAHFFIGAAYYHLGYFEEALIETDKGRRLRGADLIDPIRNEGIIALFSGNFAPARAHLEDVSRLSSQELGDTYLALAYYYSGNVERARSMLEALAAHPSPSSSSRAAAALAGILAEQGQTAAARQHLEQVEMREYRDHHVAYSIGVAYAQLGDSTAAGRWLRTAADTGFACVPWFERDPLLEPLRRRPEFAGLLADVQKRREASLPIDR
jgi:DNA-binding winged helix-turn-helix (wHTH) protein/TolB-like protein/Flp pilus assembly protein TadD